MTSSNFDILPSYIDDFHQHQSNTQNHLKGRTTTDSPLPPSFFPPSSYWTSAEKDLFFHGLTIYSRLRPELIAEHIKTKSTYDVCLYIDALQIAAGREEFPIQDIPLRQQLEPAFDVSTRWIDYEESLAADLVARDLCAANVARTTRETCNCPDDHSGSAIITGEETRECAAFLNHIDNTGLQTLDSTLREAEDERTATASESGYTSSRHGTANPGRSDDEKSIRSVSTGLDLEDEDLDPKARRRLLKRLYMRRKRAETLGRELNLQAEKLRPGRASRPRGAPKPRPKTYKSKGKARGESEDPPANEGEEVAESNQGTPDHVEFEKHSRGGLTRRYRIKEALSQSGIDSDALQAAELDLFVFSAIPRVINKKSDASFAGAISMSAIRTVNVLLKQFVRDIIRCLVITKEQENRLKGKLKVWKNDEEEITVGNVAECLQVLGFYIAPDEPEDNSGSTPLEAPIELDRRATNNPLETYQTLMLSSTPIHLTPYAEDEEDDLILSSESDSDESTYDAQLDKDDEQASALFEKGLWRIIR